ncbi:MAG: phosphomannomutase/phosphoglucomutase [Clostridia bacterium]|nr:phosphomannomutase/phosphoglucomutase [Clostridia bacterium]
MSELRALKSGTDIRGVASTVSGRDITLTDAAVFRIVCGFADYIKQQTNGALRVAVGHDCRISAERIKKQVIAALHSKGISAFDCGLSSTPAMFMTTVLADMSAAVQITASHHPSDRNGLKFFLPSGGLNSTTLDTILDLAEQNAFVPAAEPVAEPLAFMDTYCAHLRQIICRGLQKQENEQPLAGFHIVVDAGNGAGGFYAEKVLQPLGADTSGSVFLEPDGMFPNHIPNPENAAAMASISNAVKASRADFGVIFDTDVDRAACVDQTGSSINRNRLIALAAAIVLENEPGSTIVTDSVTSDGLKAFITALGGRHHRFKRGYKNVIDEAQRLCAEGENAPLAIETSGHAALKENYFLDDGAYLVTKIIIRLAALRAAGKTLDSLTDSLQTPAEEKEIRFAITEADFKGYGQKVLQALTQFAGQNPEWKIADDNYEGVRVSTAEGFFLLRMSVHDPIMPFNVESNAPGGVDTMLRALLPFFSACDGLDLSPLSHLQ